MKKDRLLIITRTFYILFVIATIISLFIVYKDIDHPFVFRFLVGYLLFTFFLCVYIPLVTTFNLKDLKWVEIRKRIIKFAIIFIVVSILSYTLQYIYKPLELNLFEVFSKGIGLAFGITFADIILFPEKNKKI